MVQCSSFRLDEIHRSTSTNNPAETFNGLLRINPEISITEIESKLIGNSYSCPYCKLTFSKRSNVFRHIKRFHDSENIAQSVLSSKDNCFHCNPCRIKFKHVEDFKKHKQQCSGPRVYLCLYCNKELTTGYNLRRHEELCKKLNDMSTEQQLSTFDVNHEGRKPETSPEMTIYRSNESSSALEYSTNTEMHQVINRKPRKSHICSYCQNSYSTAFNLKRHEEICKIKILHPQNEFN